MGLGHWGLGMVPSTKELDMIDVCTDLLDCLSSKVLICGFELIQTNDVVRNHEDTHEHIICLPQKNAGMGGG